MRPGSAAAPPVAVADRRGLSAPGAVALALALALVGGTVDVLTGPGLRLLFAVCFVLGCVLAALLVRASEVLVAVVMPPLVYVAVALVAGAVESTGAAGSWLTQELLELATALVVGMQVLVIGTGAALVIGLVRHRSFRSRAAAARRATGREVLQPR